MLVLGVAGVTARPAAADWRSETLDRSGSSGAESSTVVFRGNPHIFDRALDHTLRHVYWTGSKWVAETLDQYFPDAHGGSISSFVWANQLHVFYTAERKGALGSAPYTEFLRHQWWDGSWHTQDFELSNWGSVGTDIATAVYMGNPHAIYNSWSNNHPVTIHAYWDGHQWRKDQWPGLQTGGYAALVAGNRLQVFGGGQVTWVRTFTAGAGGGWSPAVAIDGIGSRFPGSVSCSIYQTGCVSDLGLTAVSFNGMSHIFEMGANDDLGLRHCWSVGTGWSCQELDADPGVHSMGVSAIVYEGMLHVFYEANNDLMHLYWAQGRWQPKETLVAGSWLNSAGRESSTFVWANQVHVVYSVGSDLGHTYFVPPPPYAYSVVANSIRYLRADGTPIAHSSRFWWGERGELSVTVRNTGSQTWGANGVAVRLAPSNPSDASSNPLYTAGWLSPGRVQGLPAGVTVPPSATYTFTFPFALNTGNTYAQTFNLVADGVTWFAQDPTLRFVFPFGTTVNRGVALRHHGTGGYTLAPDGTVTPFGGAPALTGTGTPSWPNWDIARGIVLRSDDLGGYVLDGWGGVHPFGNAPAMTPSAYWPNWDIARGITLRSDNKGGYVLDGWGGIHRFGAAPSVTPSAYWPNWDIARGITLRSDNKGGYVLDGWGGIHRFGTAPSVTPSAYWPNWDIARGITLRSDNKGGYVLDGWGGIHRFGTAPSLTPSAYWPNWDIARSISSTTTAGTWVLDGAGNVHQAS